MTGHKKTGEKKSGLESVRFDLRFDRFVRLVGPDAMRRVENSHAAVFGLGGVGSYAVEGLARSGIGRLTIVDFDTVCITNFNRQMQALQENISEPKVDLMAERVRLINPGIKLHAPRAFYNSESADTLLADKPDIMIDCIDNITAKMHLLAECLKRNIPVITVLGAAAKLDPTRVQVVPLSKTHADPLARAIRKFTRREYGIPDEDLDRIIAVFSDEPAILPHEGYASPVCGKDCVCPSGDNPHHSCDKRHVINGSAVFVTAAFGMTAASVAIRQLAGIPWQYSPVKGQRRQKG